ncbi:MAG: ankyrin repeat domain-containing protein [bacterium]
MKKIILLLLVIFLLASSSTIFAFYDYNNFFEACERRDYDRVLDLIRTGANVNMSNSEGTTPLMWVLEGYMNDSQIIETMKLLIENGADINLEDKKGNTALFYSSLEDDYNIAKYLLDNGGDLKYQSKINGHTPLSYAISYGNTRTLDFLINYGNLNINQEFKDGETALLLANVGYTSYMKINYLIKNGANSLKSTNCGETPLMRAASNGNPKVLEILLDNGAKIDRQNNEGMTPLIYACKNSFKPEVVEYLIDKKANTNIKDKSGKNALDYIEENEELKNTKVYYKLKEKTKPFSQKYTSKKKEYEDLTLEQQRIIEYELLNLKNKNHTYSNKTEAFYDIYFGDSPKEVYNKISEENQLVDSLEEKSKKYNYSIKERLEKRKEEAGFKYLVGEFNADISYTYIFIFDEQDKLISLLMIGNLYNSRNDTKKINEEFKSINDFANWINSRYITSPAPKIRNDGYNWIPGTNSWMNIWPKEQLDSNLEVKVGIHLDKKSEQKTENVIMQVTYKK